MPLPSKDLVPQTNPLEKWTSAYSAVRERSDMTSMMKQMFVHNIQNVKAAQGAPPAQPVLLTMPPSAAPGHGPASNPTGRARATTPTFSTSSESTSDSESSSSLTRRTETRKSVQRTKGKQPARRSGTSSDGDRQISHSRRRAPRLSGKTKSACIPHAPRRKRSASTSSGSTTMTRSRSVSPTVSSDIKGARDQGSKTKAVIAEAKVKQKKNRETTRRVPQARTRPNTLSAATSKTPDSSREALRPQSVIRTAQYDLERSFRRRSDLDSAIGHLDPPTVSRSRLRTAEVTVKRSERLMEQSPAKANRTPLVPIPKLSRRSKPVRMKATHPISCSPVESVFSASSESSQSWPPWDEAFAKPRQVGQPVPGKAETIGIAKPGQKAASKAFSRPPDVRFEGEAWYDGVMYRTTFEKGERGLTFTYFDDITTGSIRTYNLNTSDFEATELPNGRFTTMTASLSVQEDYVAILETATKRSDVRRRMHMSSQRVAGIKVRIRFEWILVTLPPYRFTTDLLLIGYLRRGNRFITSFPSTIPTTEEFLRTGPVQFKWPLVEDVDARIWNGCLEEVEEIEVAFRGHLSHRHVYRIGDVLLD